jgi:uncharacterized SAM-binding protein YcdF (DUF218 family)
MGIYLNKLLPVLFLPTGLLLLLLLAGLLLRLRWPLILAFALLWIGSTPWVSDRLQRSVEDDAIRVPAREMPQADAIVVLSEGRVVAPGPARISEWTDGDRFWGGIELFKAGKAPLLIFTGGWAPWLTGARPEGEILSEWAVTQGVPQSAIRLTGKVTNTAEEAAETAAILQESGRAKAAEKPSVLLVTSGYHMPRAQRQFEAAGLVVTPYPVDFQVGQERDFSVLSLVPTAQAWARTESAWREWIGRAFYALKYQIAGQKAGSA